MVADIDLAYLEQWIGRAQVAEDILTPSLVDRFNATIGLQAQRTQLGDVAPRLIHFCLCVDAVAMAGLGQDGHPAKGDFLPPVPLPRRMWASSDIEFSGDIRVGDAVRRESRIASVALKHGRAGSLCFVEVEHRVLADQRLAVTERQTLVYKQDGPPAPAQAGDAAPMGAAVQSVQPSEPMLFRYSALTFNAHRIHYDLPYAMGVEGYPALVVHGPLQATLLLHFAAQQHGGRAPDSFVFRGLAPAFAGQALTLHADGIDAGKMELWTAATAGPIAMKATAHWR